VQAHRALPRIRKAGAELVFVGNGNQHFGRAFREDLRIEAPIYVDTERRAYEALGMRRGVGAAIGSLGALKNVARALKGGFRQGPVQGDPWQLGGVLVVRPGGAVTYRYLSRALGDHPRVDDAVAALEDRSR
jgi:hypothetical protein